MKLGTSVVYSLVDLAYLYNKPLSFGYKLRATLIYLRLTLLYLFYGASRMRVSSTKIFGRKVKFDSFGVFAFLFREVFVKNEYHFSFKKKPVIIDCGANIGMSILYFKKLFPNAQVYGFEPLPQNLMYLRENTEGLPNVEIIPAAVSDKDGSMRFFFDQNNPGSGLSSLFEKRGGQDNVKVKTVRLSSFIKKHKPNVMKMDIEGAEVRVMADLEKTGALKHLDLIMIEYHHYIGNDASFSAFLKILEKNGFTYYIDAALAPRSHTEDIMIYATRYRD